MSFLFLALASAELLACTDKKGGRLLIAAADKEYWDYRYQVGEYGTQARFKAIFSAEQLADFQSSLTCGPAVRPDLTCDSCTGHSMEQEALDFCKEATIETFPAVQAAALEKGLNCLVGATTSYKTNVEDCVSSDDYHQACVLGSDAALAEAETKATEAVAEVQVEAANLRARVERVDKAFAVSVTRTAAGATIAQVPGMPSELGQLIGGMASPHLACTAGETRIVIAAKDQAYWDYRFAKGEYFTQMNWPWSPEQLASFQRQMTCVPVDAPSSFTCDKCVQTDFDVSFLDQCAAVADKAAFKPTQEKVVEQGGNCLVGGSVSHAADLPDCLRDNGIAGCEVDTSADVGKKQQALAAKEEALAEAATAARSHAAAVKQLFGGENVRRHGRRHGE